MMKRLSEWLKNRSSLSIIVAVAVLLQMISATQYYYAHSLLEEELEKRAESELTMKAIIAKNTLNTAEYALKGQIWNMKRTIDNPDSLYNAAEWVLRSYPNMFGCGIAFEPHFYPEKGKLYEPYVFRLNGRLVKRQLGGPDHDYTQLPFYREAKERNTAAWNDPYHDPMTGHNLVTYCRPIHNDRNELVAVLGLDIDLDFLGDTLSYRHIYPSSFELLLTESGKLIAGPKKNRMKVGEVENIVNMINDSSVVKTPSRSKRSKVFSFKDPDGDKGLVFYAPFRGQPKWQIAVVCYNKEVYAKLRMMRVTSGVVMLIALLAMGLIVHRYSKNMRRLHLAKVEKERIDSELRVAKEIQKEMLPSTSNLHRDDVSLWGSLTPAREVGGDIFDFFIRDEKLFFCIGDVSGKGVPSAMLMGVIHSLFRSASAHESNPSRIVHLINETSCEGNESNMFVTLFVGVLDLPSGRLRYCNAGHDVPVLIGETVESLPVEANLPIGLFNDFKYEMQEYLLPPMTTIFFYTDGLTEAMNVAHKQFGKDRMLKVLDGHKHAMPQELMEVMSSEVRGFAAGAEQSDDLTMLVIRYTPQTEQTILSESLVLGNDVKQVTRLSQFVKSVTERLGIEPKMVKKLRLATEEAVVNIMNYAYPEGKEGEITVEAKADEHSLKFVISDTGVPFDPTETVRADITLSVEERPVGGLGILLVRDMMDSVNYERVDGKNILTLTKNVEITKLNNKKEV